ncbi:hypothetical protein FACS1894202_13310 [Clostridia bacterium]|nr:hypothetical protein FACS1894202_13310 [Clostridia bacterium]
MGCCGVGKADTLLPKVKANLIIEHDGDDELLRGFIRAAVDYAEQYQKVTYGRRNLPPSTEQAVIMLASHYYESRDGATGGYFADTALAGNNARAAIDRLLNMHKKWEV